MSLLPPLQKTPVATSYGAVATTVTFPNPTTPGNAIPFSYVSFDTGETSRTFTIVDNGTGGSNTYVKDFQNGHSFGLLNHLVGSCVVAAHSLTTLTVTASGSATTGVPRGALVAYEVPYSGTLAYDT